MSLEQILKRIIDDAQAEADRVVRESQEKAAEIKAKAEQEASGLAEALVKEVENHGSLETSRIITQARLEAKIRILSQKKELIQEVLDKAFQKQGLQKQGLKRKIITKEGEIEEPVEEERLREELRSKLENEIVEVLGI